MSSPNFVYLEGYIQRAEEREVGRNGNRVLSFTLAVRGRGEDAEYSYFDVDHWNTPSKIAEAIIDAGESEGSSRKFAVRGSLKQDRWETEDGDKRSRVKIAATTVFAPFYSEEDDDDDEGGSRRRSKKKSKKKSSKRGGSRKKSSSRRGGGGKKRRRRDEDEDYEDPDEESEEEDEDDDDVPF